MGESRRVGPPAGASATGLVFACGVCLHRFPKTERCPRCGADGVRDLRLPEGRESILRALDRPSWLSILNVGWRWPIFAIVTLICGLNACLSALADALPLNERAWGVLIYGGIPVLLYFLLGKHESFREGPARSVGFAPLKLFASASVPHAPESTRRGTVRVRRAVRSPTGVECAAWRMTGVGPGGRLDDADVGAFEVLSEDRVVGVVDTPDAFVDVGPLPARRRITVTAALAEVLECRGALPKSASCDLAEGVIVDGDRVEVIGSIGADPTGDATFTAWPTVRKIA